MSDELEKTKKEYQNLKNEYDEFVHNSFHDLAGNLRTIDGFSNLIHKKHSRSLNDDGKRLLNTIRERIDDSINTLSSMMEFYQASSADIILSEYDLTSAFEEAEEILSDLIEESKAKIHYEKLPLIQADPRFINLLITQLIKNSLIFRQKTITPQISVTATDQGDFWEFCISDNGIGVDKDLQERMFRILKQATGNKDYPGAGMGLATCKRIVEKHNGKIWSESASGSTKIYFTLLKSRKY